MAQTKPGAYDGLGMYRRLEQTCQPAAAPSKTYMAGTASRLGRASHTSVTKNSPVLKAGSG